MNLSEMEADLQKRIRRSTSLRMRVIAGIILMLVLGGLFYVQLTSPLQIQKRKNHASLQFGEALERAGIGSQSGPSK